jgi:Skp family chaperone for outer membrane proteins
MKALLLIGLMVMVFPAQADVYRCQDSAGKTMYQEAPCEKANLTTVKKLAKPMGEPSPEAIEKAQAESRALVQRYNERKKAEQEASKKEKEHQETEQKKTAQPDEQTAGGQ